MLKNEFKNIDSLLKDIFKSKTAIRTSHNNLTIVERLAFTRYAFTVL